MRGAGGPVWSETFLALQSASSVEELWAVLLSWHGIRSSTQWEEPYLLFRRFHADEPAGAAVTAALLCTDHRWRKASHHLIARLTESGLLSQVDERQLAEWFIADDGFEVEVATVDDPEVVVSQEPGCSDDSDRPFGAEVGLAALTRPIWPPLRRWAAARLVAEDPSRWRELMDAAQVMPSRDGAALAAGVLDAAAHIPLDPRRDAAMAGLSFGSGIVRLAALPVYAALEGAEAAFHRAGADPSAKVRAWVPSATPAEDPRHTSMPATAGDRPGVEPPGQASLF